MSEMTVCLHTAFLLFLPSLDTSWMLIVALLCSMLTSLKCHSEHRSLQTSCDCSQQVIPMPTHRHDRPNQRQSSISLTRITTRIQHSSQTAFQWAWLTFLAPKTIHSKATSMTFVFLMMIVTHLSIRSRLQKHISCMKVCEPM